MTEAQWLACKDPDAMLEHLRNQASDRQFRLFVCACCRRFLPLLTGPHQAAFPICEKAVTVAERFADGLANLKKLRASLPVGVLTLDIEVDCLLAAYAVHRATFVQLAGDPRPMRFGKRLIGHPASEGAEFARGAVGVLGAAKARATGKTRATILRTATIQEKRAEVQYLRDLFGNPFRPFPPKEPDPVWTTQRQQWLAWNKGVIPKLAQSIYDERTFDRLPVLADALEEAGCTNADLLDHCRRPGEHVRGCWILDHLLSKEVKA